eukprot:TRINITY_DN2662_c0_g1_i2.p1 TRINITY_DN2662_c0_g1~~TRINITY_DN2662_c0_g1_i2.p1  ORF type:complete len:327 (-),score=63.71 TRINITY_DN2662_c0_g1_i2:3-983(-)
MNPRTELMNLMRYTFTTHFSHTIVQPLKPLRFLHSALTPFSQPHHSRFHVYKPPHSFQQRHFYSTNARVDISTNTSPYSSTTFLQNIVNIVLFGNHFLKGTHADLSLVNNIHNPPSFSVDGKNLALNEWYQFIRSSGGKEIIVGKEGSKLVLISHHSHSNKSYTLMWKYTKLHFESAPCEYEKFLKWKSLQLGSIRETLQEAVQRSRDVAMRHNTPDEQSLGHAEDVLNSGLAEKTISRLSVSQSVPPRCIYEPIGRVALQVLQAAYHTLNFFENNHYMFNKLSNHHSELKEGYFSNDQKQINDHLLSAVEDAILVTKNYIVETSF